MSKTTTIDPQKPPLHDDAWNLEDIIRRNNGGTVKPTPGIAPVIPPSSNPVFTPNIVRKK